MAFIIFVHKSDANKESQEIQIQFQRKSMA